LSARKKKVPYIMKRAMGVTIETSKSLTVDQICCLTITCRHARPQKAKIAWKHAETSQT